METFHIRQGDVLIVAAPHISGKIPNAKEEPREDGRVVLAHGEATGHAHVIDAPDAVIVVDEREQRFLRMMSPGPVRHDCPGQSMPDHFDIHWPADVCNTGQVVQQCEYTPGAVRYVAD
jgi:hypothetical protein